MLVAVVIILIILLFVTGWLAFYVNFRVKSQFDGSDETQLMNSARFPYEREMSSGIAWIKARKWEDVYISSRDGLRLHARWLKKKGSDKAALLFHGYRSMAHNDFCVTAPWLWEKGYSLLLVDQRAHSESEGKWLTFGARERYDCRLWIDKVLEIAGKDTRLLLSGVSMGATTVLLALGLGLPENVRAVVADCGFTSPKEIMRYYIKKRFNMPVFPLLQILGLYFRLICGFWPASLNTALLLKENKDIPVLFVHGQADITVPPEMTEENYKACAAPKRILTYEHASHAVCSLAYKEEYFLELKSFLEESFG
jgi:fermentation-respiration switch protein FrsA (DUF1100 family)